MFAYFRTSLSWRELTRRLIAASVDDDATALAAQLAYYFFLALFPALLTLVAIASLFPLHNLADVIDRLLINVAPAEVLAIIRHELMRIANGDRVGLLSLGLAGALWSSSNALTAIVDTMNRAYNVQETRSWWRVRLLAVALTLGLSVFVLLSLMLVLAGPQFADWLGRLGAGVVFAWTWKILQWPIVFALVTVAISSVYYFGPNTRQVWVWVTPGSVLSTTLWLVGSLLLRVYVVRWGLYETTYGAIGAVIVVMLWFWWMGLALIIGAELDAEIEHASPWGRGREGPPAPPCAVGLAAEREHDARRQLTAVPAQVSARR